MSIPNSKFKLLIVFSLIGVLWIIACRQIPFYWDMLNYSRQANFLLEGNFLKKFPAEIDYGHPPLYAYYLFLIWKFTCKSLLVSHLAALPFYLSILFFIYKQYQQTETLFFAFILILLEPCFVSMLSYMNSELALSACFLLSLLALQKKRYLVFVLTASLMLLVNLRAIPLYAALALVAFIQRSGHINSKLIACFIFPLLILSGWLYVHYVQSGWFFVAPNMLGHRSLVGFSSIFKNIILQVFQILDSGRIALWLVWFYAYYKGKIKSLQATVLVVCAGTLLLSNALFNNPFGHKYFLTLYILLIIDVAGVLGGFTQKWKFRFFAVCAITLISGHWWMYPSRFANTWDSTLKAVPSFNINKNLLLFVKKQNIACEDIAAAFPLNLDVGNAYLSNDNCKISDINDYSFYAFKYVIVSNLSNNINAKRDNEIKQKWTCLWSQSCGQVQISLYQNPVPIF